MNPPTFNSIYLLCTKSVTLTEIGITCTCKIGGDRLGLGFFKKLLFPMSLFDAEDMTVEVNGVSQPSQMA